MLGWKVGPTVASDTPGGCKGAGVKSPERLLNILGLFSVDRFEWSVEAAARELALSNSSAYAYFKNLVDAGFLTPSRKGRYVIGPAIIEYDRLARISDPLIRAAQAPLNQLVSGPLPAVALLCRLYRMTVMCVEHAASPAARFAVGYERGRPMPLFRGAASKIILAHIPRRKLRRYFDEFAREVAFVGLGDDWGSFKARLREIRNADVYVTMGEVDPGRVGLAAPIFSSEGEIIASVGFVLRDVDFAAHSDVAAELKRNVAATAAMITATLPSLSILNGRAIEDS